MILIEGMFWIAERGEYVSVYIYDYEYWYLIMQKAKQKIFVLYGIFQFHGCFQYFISIV